MHKRTLLTMLAVPIAALTATAVLSQDKGSVDPKPLPPLVNPNDPELGAKELFGRKTSPAPLATHSIGFYDKGCLAGDDVITVGPTRLLVGHQRSPVHLGLKPQHPIVVRVYRLEQEAVFDACVRDGWPLHEFPAVARIVLRAPQITARI